MHCYECEKPLLVIPAADDFFIYDFKIEAYHNKPAIIIECPHCRSLLVLINYTKKDLMKLPIDKSLQVISDVPTNKERKTDYT